MRQYISLNAALISIAFAAGCSQATPPATEAADTSSANVEVANATESKRPNFILMIGDDMAVETLSCYGVGQTTAKTPNLDKLCAAGVRFDNFWSQPVCSPTRATLLTGQYGFANGVGFPIGPMRDVEWNIPEEVRSEIFTPPGGEGGGPGLKPGAHTFLTALKADADADYKTAAVGKWHLATNENGGLDNPNLAGFDHYSGSMRTGEVVSYSAWSQVEDGGEPYGKYGYATSSIIDDGIAWINSVNDTSPWFLWVAFNAPHTPFHVPPAELLSPETAASIDPETATNLQKYQAMIEAMDIEIGRLLGSLDPETAANTYVIFMGDNGTPGQTATAPFVRQKAKGSLYQGGVNVPFMVAGPGIEAGQVSKSLANSVDMFATVLDLSGVALQSNEVDQPFHSVSLKPILLDSPDDEVRDFAFADVFGNRRGQYANERTIRDETYKLVENLVTGSRELYNLNTDPYETTNLLAGEPSDADKAHLAALTAEVETLTGTPSPE